MVKAKRPTPREVAQMSSGKFERWLGTATSAEIAAWKRENDRALARFGRELQAKSDAETQAWVYRQPHDQLVKIKTWCEERLRRSRKERSHGKN